jgi:CheY-like chemotaxis protein
MIRVKKVKPVKQPDPDTAVLADPVADIGALEDPVANTDLDDADLALALLDTDADTDLIDPDADTGMVAADLDLALDVALVDDDPVIGVMITRVLVSKGYSVTWFEDGLAAVAALCKPNPSVRAKLILLDVSMPGLGGWGVLHYLARDGVLDNSRVIMLTASTSEQDVRQAIGLGATGYLAKPLNIRLLILRVKHALGK